MTLALAARLDWNDFGFQAALAATLESMIGLE